MYVENRLVYKGHTFDNQVVGNYLFQTDNHSTMYLAGLYDPEDGKGRYTIITTDANASVDIHTRMPVVLRREECKAWLAGRIVFCDIKD